MTTYNLAALLEDTAAQHPDRTAIVIGEFVPVPLMERML